MTQLQRFLFLIVLLILAGALIYGFDTTHKKKMEPLRSTITMTPTIATTLIPTAGAHHWDDYTSRDITIEGKQYHVLVADTEEKQELGLMYITTLDGYDGMVFDFPDISVKSFWNKNTLIDLDMVWMNGETVVGREVLPSIYKTGNPKTITSPGEVNTVVELLIKK